MIRVNEGKLKNVPLKILGSQNPIQPLPTMLQLCAKVCKIFVQKHVGKIKQNNLNLSLHILHITVCELKLIDLNVTENKEL
jgi:hypothetical protein